MTDKRESLNGKEIIRCGWCGTQELYVEYHDKEWGKFISDENRLFEFLLLESAQAGLSWWTTLQRRENYREAFAEFDPKLIAKFDQDDVERLVVDSGIIRHRGKIEATINNAKRFLEVQSEFGSFESFILSFFPNGERIINHPKTIEEVPATSPLSDLISKEMRRRGFKFWGTTTCYAFLQATGFIDDHIVSCSFK